MKKALRNRLDETSESFYVCRRSSAKIVFSLFSKDTHLTEL